MAKFGEIIRVMRIKRGYSQAKLAQKMGIGRSAIANYECGLREPDLDTVEAFADFFDVSMDDLLGREDETIPATEESHETDRPKWIKLSAGKRVLTDAQLDLLYNMAHQMNPEAFPIDDGKDDNE